MLRFLHASEQAALRRKELRDLPGLLCDLAREQDCSLILLSGDLFDTVGGYPETTEALLRAFSGSRAHILIAPGNHDFFTAASPYARMNWPENVHIFRSETPECIHIPEQNACVWGAAFRSESSPPLLEGFHAPQTGEYQLMVLHGDPENPASPYNPISAPQIASSGLDYLALGHIHSRSGLLHAGNTAYAWPAVPWGADLMKPVKKACMSANWMKQDAVFSFTLCRADAMNAWKFLPAKFPWSPSNRL